MRKNTVAIGFRTKTGKAIAIAVSDGGESPEFAGRWNIEIYDPLVPATGQPHHEVMELPWPDARVAVRPNEDRIFSVATERLASIVEELRRQGTEVRAIGVVGSPDRNLEKIGNRHMRAHAAEGMLFRHAMEVAADRCGIAWRGFGDRGFGEPSLADALADMGRAAGRPWRADERAAATAAWLAFGVRRA